MVLLFYLIHFLLHKHVNTETATNCMSVDDKLQCVYCLQYENVCIQIGGGGGGEVR